MVYIIPKHTHKTMRLKLIWRWVVLVAHAKVNLSQKPFWNVPWNPATNLTEWVKNKQVSHLWEGHYPTRGWASPSLPFHLAALTLVLQEPQPPSPLPALAGQKHMKGTQSKALDDAERYGTGDLLSLAAGTWIHHSCGTSQQTALSPVPEMGPFILSSSETLPQDLKPWQMRYQTLTYWFLAWSWRIWEFGGFWTRFLSYCTWSPVAPTSYWNSTGPSFSEQSGAS